VRDLGALNYVHFGNSLSLLSKLDGHYQDLVPKEQLLHLFSGSKGEEFVREIIESRSLARRRRVDCDSLRRDVSSSITARRAFRSLGCRGFSYQLVNNPCGFWLPLRRTSRVRMALLAHENLFYPRSVRRGLKKARDAHFPDQEQSTIAFAFGLIQDASLVLSVLQSDTVRYGDSAVRDHFRGWRKVLLVNAVGSYKEGVERVLLCRAEDVLRACHPLFDSPREVPEGWRVIYDDTARFFTMSEVRTPEPIDIQVLSGCPDVLTDRFFELRLDDGGLPILPRGRCL